MTGKDIFNAITSLPTGGVKYFSLAALERAGLGNISSLPYTIRILLEAALRKFDGFAVTEDHIRALAGWKPGCGGAGNEVPFLPARVLLQDFTGVPALVDMAAMRSAMSRAGHDPARINPVIPADLVIDHSIQVDYFGTSDSAAKNTKREFERNGERYRFLRWGQSAFKNFRVVPPGGGIVHQVNLEVLANVVQTAEINGMKVAFPDSLVGTDSHTTMINGLGVLGWGVGGIEAEAVMLGQPLYMTMPEVVGVELSGALPEGATATDLVLTVTQMLRKHGVVGKLVEFYGDGLDSLSLPDRATVANMAPEYGATSGFFPVDDEALRYLRTTNRPAELVSLIETYLKEQGLFRGLSTPVYSETVKLDMSGIEPSIAGPRRPQERIPLKNARASFNESLSSVYGKQAGAGATVSIDGAESRLDHGSVVIAAITSCTNTSNPSVLLAAGLLAKKAVERGVTVKPWVKTSIGAGSRVVSGYLNAAGLMPYLEALRFHIIGFGCTTCIGNSGTLSDAVSEAIRANDITAAAVLSGNRNFEGRVNPLVKANYLASPPLVVAYAIAGTMNIDIMNEPLCHDPNGAPVYLRDIWPSNAEVNAALSSVTPELFQAESERVFSGGDEWKAISTSGGMLYEWDAESTYIREPSFFGNLQGDVAPIAPINGARALLMLGDSVTTDHISPAGSIAKTSAAAVYLTSKGIAQADFNSYGARRGNHEVMMRGTFANIRLRNLLAPGTEGGVTTYFSPTGPTSGPAAGEVMSVFDASTRYAADGVPLVILAGKEYGAGSSRDWAAKGTMLLGVKAVIAESYERIHRANLVGMGVLPLQFADGQNRETLGLAGNETFSIALPENPEPGQMVRVTAVSPDGSRKEFDAVSRLDSPVDVSYYRNGGILQTVLREMMG
ncbi:MAG: aconitate hydratase AcnA [Nitrospirae bacterium]|nr:aconitate hydratase AcnA [Nitrospirota bacterium]